MEIIHWQDDSREVTPMFGPQLEESQRHDIEEILHAFSDLFQDKPGRTALIEHQVDTGNAAPVQQRHYHLPQAYKEAVHKEIQEMLDAGLIQPSVSEWASPVVAVQKKDGSLRLFVDYCKLNAVSQADAHPMPRVDELLDNLGQAKYISTLDLTKAYWQVPVAEKDCGKTAFTAGAGLFQFNMMPFGLKGAPATSQRLMDMVLTGMGAAYMDDVLIFSMTWEDHLQHI